MSSWTGRVSAKGHDPFGYLALTDDGGRLWRLKGDAEAILWSQAQGRRVRVTGHVEDREFILVETWELVPEKEPL